MQDGPRGHTCLSCRVAEERMQPGRNQTAGQKPTCQATDLQTNYGWPTRLIRENDVRGRAGSVGGVS